MRNPSLQVACGGKCCPRNGDSYHDFDHRTAVCIDHGERDSWPKLLALFSPYLFIYMHRNHEVSSLNICLERSANKWCWSHEEVTWESNSSFPANQARTLLSFREQRSFLEVCAKTNQTVRMKKWQPVHWSNAFEFMNQTQIPAKAFCFPLVWYKEIQNSVIT